MTIKISTVMLKLERLQLHLQGQKIMLKDQLQYEEEMVIYLKNNLKCLKSVNKSLKNAKISKIKKKMEILRSRSGSRKSITKNSDHLEEIPQKIDAKNSYEYYQNVLSTLRKNRLIRRNSPHRRDSLTSKTEIRSKNNNFLEIESEDENKTTEKGNHQNKLSTPKRRVSIPVSPSTREKRIPPTPPKYTQKMLDYYTKNGIFEPKTQDTVKNKTQEDLSENLENSSEKKIYRRKSDKKKTNKKVKEEYIKRYQKHQISIEIRKPPVLLKGKNESVSKESSKDIYQYSDQVILEEAEEEEESFRVEISDFRRREFERGDDDAVKKLEFGAKFGEEGGSLIASFGVKGGF